MPDLSAAPHMTWQGHPTNYEEGGRGIIAGLGNFALQQQGGVEEEVMVMDYGGMRKGIASGMQDIDLCTNLFNSLISVIYSLSFHA